MIFELAVSTNGTNTALVRGETCTRVVSHAINFVCFKKKIKHRTLIPGSARLYSELSIRYGTLTRGTSLSLDYFNLGDLLCMTKNPWEPSYLPVPMSVTSRSFYHCLKVSNWRSLITWFLFCRKCPTSVAGAFPVEQGESNPTPSGLLYTMVDVLWYYGHWGRGIRWSSGALGQNNRR